MEEGYWREREKRREREEKREREKRESEREKLRTEVAKKYTDPMHMGVG